MIGQIWAILKFLSELWDALKIAIGFVKKEQHDRELKEITEESDKAGDSSLPLEERMKAGQNLEEKFNDHI